MLPNGLVQRSLITLTIGRMTSAQTRREPRGPVGSESTYWLLSARSGIFGLVEMHGRTGRGDMMRRMVRRRIRKDRHSCHKFSRLTRSLALGRYKPAILALGFAILLAWGCQCLVGPALRPCQHMVLIHSLRNGRTNCGIHSCCHWNSQRQSSIWPRRRNSNQQRRIAHS